MNKALELSAYMAGNQNIPADVVEVVQALTGVAKTLSKKISRGALEGAMGASVGKNSDGDTQKALDVIADEMFFEQICKTSVRWFASEERAEVVAASASGRLALAIDPLDGSSNIDVNMSIGTIFSIYEAKDDGDESFLRPGIDQVAGGYIIYGPQTAMMITFGKGTLSAILDPERGEFLVLDQTVKIPGCANEFAINASNYRHWPTPVRAYIDDCYSGETGPRGKNFNMRWIASLVAETHRILTRGGIFLYPNDNRKGYEQGRLRMVYECAPIALLLEQAGGQATDGCDRLLEQRAKTLHARTSFVFGTADKVSRLSAYYDLPEFEAPALFRNRGLFRD